jgi:hypothetical protein
MYYPKNEDDWYQILHNDGCDARPWDVWIERLLCYCQSGGVYHECCSGCGVAIDGCYADGGIHKGKV